MRRLLWVGLCLVIAGCAGTAASSPSAPPAASLGTQGEQTDGLFRLTLVVPRATWSTTESIEGTATLSYLGSGSKTIGGSSTLIAFSVGEVGGSRHVEGVVTGDCAPHSIGADSPIATGLSKSGGYDPGQPGASFVASFLDSPGFRLPSGAWDITAFAGFSESACDAPWHSLRVAVRVQVTG